MFNKQVIKTIDLLKNEFNIILEEKTDLISDFTIGIEIEVKFQSYFPEIFDKYFKNKKYLQFTEQEKENITNEISITEKDILKNLNKTIELGIPKGNDAYWEFAFNPVNNLTDVLTLTNINNRSCIVCVI